MLGLDIAALGSQGMKVFVKIFSLMFLPEAGTAAAGPAQPCILKATEALPKVAGMTVKKASTRPMSPEQLANWKGQTKPVIVDLDMFATELQRTYSYVCSAGGVGHVFVQRIMSQ
jgi:hypothetical protein